MICQWQPLLSILPPQIAAEVDRQDRNRIQELRLRLGRKVLLCFGNENTELNLPVSRTDIQYVINTASRYSPWAAATMAQGFLTAAGGHRIGICGEAVIQQGQLVGLKNPTALCIRVARDYPGIGREISHLNGSILLIGPPGSGKTTMLRDVMRQISQKETVSVIDERGEILPDKLCPDVGLDVLTGCSKPEGIGMVLRAMGPMCIGVDEITSEADCDALIRAGWCGVRLVATAHAADMKDLLRRPIYKKLCQSGLFDHLVVLRRDKSWTVERMAA